MESLTHAPPRPRERACLQTRHCRIGKRAWFPSPLPHRPSTTIQTAALRNSIKMGDSILTRKRDLVYLIFFIIHLPVMLGA
jgi:hypothetical protein